MTLDMIWLLIMILLVVVEISTMELKSFWFVLSASVAYFLSKGETEFYIQVLIFLLGGILLLSTLRNLGLRYLKVLKDKFIKSKKKM